MAYIANSINENGVNCSYWRIISFSIDFSKKDSIILTVEFEGYYSKQARLEGYKPLKVYKEVITLPYLQIQINESIFYDKDLKKFLYDCKNYYTFFKDAIDDI